MGNKIKAARYSNTKTAKIKQVQHYFNKSAKRIKLEFIRLAAWLSILGG